MLVIVLSTTYPSLKNNSERLRAPDFVYRLSYGMSRTQRVTVIAPSSVNRYQEWVNSEFREIFFPFFWRGVSSLIGEGGILERLRNKRARIIQVPFLIFAHLFFGAMVILKARGPITIHAHWLVYCGMVGFFLKSFFFWKRIRLIVTVHGSDSFFFRYPVLRSILRIALRSSDAVTCVSTGLADAVKELSGIESRLMPMGVPDSLFAPRKWVQRMDGRLLFVGRVVASKGVDHIVAALAYLPKRFHLVIVGDGPYVPALKSHVLKGLQASRVSFCGWLNEEGVKEQMSIASCLVLPSESEGFSITVLEAMAARLPVVANDIPALRAQLEGGRGYLVNVADSVALSKSILSAVERDGSVIKSANSFAEKYRWPSVVDGYQALYREIAFQRL